jgi:hypothetical protein
MEKAECINMAYRQIMKICPNDIGGQMVLAAFAQDAIDQEFPKKTEEPQSANGGSV